MKEEEEDGRGGGKARGVMFLGEVELGVVWEVMEENEGVDLDFLLSLGACSLLARGGVTTEPEGRRGVRGGGGVECGGVVKSGLVSPFLESQYVVYCPRQVEVRYVVLLEWGVGRC